MSNKLNLATEFLKISPATSVLATNSLVKFIFISFFSSISFSKASVGYKDFVLFSHEQQIVC